MTTRGPNAGEEFRPIYRMIGKRLRWARELAYPSQAAFARAMEVAQSTINKVENGERTLSIKTLIYAAAMLRTGPDYLLFGELRRLDWPTPKVMQLLKLHPELLEDPPPLPKRGHPTVRNLMGWDEC